MTEAFLNAAVTVIMLVIVGLALEMSNIETRKKIAELDKKIEKLTKEKAE